MIARGTSRVGLTASPDMQQISAMQQAMSARVSEYQILRLLHAKTQNEPSNPMYPKKEDVAPRITPPA